MKITINLNKKNFLRVGAGVLLVGVFFAGIVFGSRLKGSSSIFLQQAQESAAVNSKEPSTRPSPTAKATKKPTQIKKKISPTFKPSETKKSIITSAERVVVGSWTHLGGEAYPATINLKTDKTFTFKGLISESFTSKGNWQYDSRKEYLTLKFTEDADRWNKMMLQEVIDWHKDIITAKKGSEPSATFYVAYQATGGGSKRARRLNFMGYIFYLK